MEEGKGGSCIGNNRKRDGSRDDTCRQMCAGPGERRKRGGFFAFSCRFSCKKREKLQEKDGNEEEDIVKNYGLSIRIWTKTVHTSKVHLSASGKHCVSGCETL